MVRERIRVVFIMPVRGEYVTVRYGCPCAFQARRLRPDLSVTLRQELVDAGDLVIRDAAQRVGRPRPRIDIIRLGRFDPGMSDRC